MDAQRQRIAASCLEAAESGRLTFPQIVATLIEAGFESYCVDFRQSQASYFLADGTSCTLPMPPLDVPVAEAFDTVQVKVAIREAQLLVPGYTYRGFCQKVAEAGCAFYIVSFTGRRALYVGRTAETHVELFPG